MPLPSKRTTDLEVVVVQAIGDKVKNSKGEMSPCTGLTVCTLDALDNPLNEVYTVGIAGHQTPQQLAETVWNRSNVAASGSEDKLSFRVSFFYGDDVERRPHKFSVVSPLAFGEGGTAEGTAKGLLKNIMSAFNHTLAQTFSQQQALNDSLIRMNERLAMQLDKAMDKKESAIEQLEAAIRIMQLMRAQDEDQSHAHKMELVDKEAKAAMWTKLLEFAPAALQSMTGKPVLGQGNADTAIVKSLFAALDKSGDQELVMRLLSKLSPIEQGVVTDRALALKKEVEDEQNRRNAAMQAVDKLPKLPPELGPLLGEGNKNEQH